MNGGDEMTTRQRAKKQQREGSARAVAYLRVSTEEQRDLRDWLREKGYAVEFR